MSEAILSWLGRETGPSFGWLGQETGHNMSEISIRWGITLLHFLWQGAVIGLLALVAARLLRSQSASVRYWLNAVALLACPICVAWTFAVVDVPESWRVSSNQQSHGSLDSGWIPIETSSADDLVDVPYPKLDPPEVVSNADEASASFDAASRIPATTPVEIDTTTSSTSEWMPIVARWIASLYAVGVVCFLVRLAIALWGGHRLRAISTPVSDSALLELIRTQAHHIGLKLVPVVAYCERVAVPTVIGVLRPMILLPATLTTGLTTDELSAILSHELAHIRRYDLWMNLLQRIIESLLFFHPVVWLVSHRLSAEREICCDDLVIRSGHQPMNYAGALLRMAELCAGISPQNSVSLAATSGGTNLLEHRVLRLIHKSPSTRLSLNRKGVLLLSVLLIVTGTMWASANSWLASRIPREQPTSFTEPTTHDRDESNSDSSKQAGPASITEPKTQETDTNYVTVKGRVELEDGTLVDKSGWVYVRSRGIEKSSTGTGNLEGGLFSEKLNPGKIFVTAHVEGYAPAWTEEFELSEGTRDDFVLVLKPGFTKTIRIVDETGTPVAGATIRKHPEIHGQSIGSTIDVTTDADGLFKLEHLADTPYSLTISAAGFQTLRRDSVRLFGEDELKLTLSRARPATGQVFNADGTAASGAEIRKCIESWSKAPNSSASHITASSGENRWLGERLVATDLDGKYNLTELNDVSQYLIIIEGADGSRLALSDVVAGQTDRRITLPKRRDLVISVTGDTSSLPMRNGRPFVSVRQQISVPTVEDERNSVNLGADIPLELDADGGSVNYQGLIVDLQADPDAAEVEVGLGYSDDLKKTVRIEPDGETKVTFELPPAQTEADASLGDINSDSAVAATDPAPQAAAAKPDESEEPRTEPISITGRVLDVNQTPLAGVRVFVVSSQHGAFRNLAETVSKEDGSYKFSNVALPIILDEMFGRRESVGAFEVFAISEAHGFTWRASRAFRPDSKPSRSTMIDGDMEAPIETEFPAPDSPPEFFSGDDIEMDLVFDKPTKMRLRVVDDEGQPIQSARVRLWNADPIPGFVRERFWSQVRRQSMGFQTLYDSRLMPEELVSRTTDKDGWFEYSAMPLNCEFRIEVNPEGFAKRMIHATTGENYKSQHTVLYRNDENVVFPRTAEVTVSVEFADTQQPAPRVWVSGGALHGSGSQYGSTNESGEVVLSLPPGECAFQVLPEYKTAYVFVDDDSLRCMVEKGEEEPILRSRCNVLSKSKSA